VVYSTTGGITMPLLKEKEHYTYADYLEWDENYRAEIINGEVYEMSPPLTIHQRISMRLSVKFSTFLERKTCEVFAAPFGVRLFPEPDLSDDTVLEPDLVVICDSSKIDERGCNGAPDLVIEILSPSTANKDLILKFNLYLEAAVREYWVIEPENRQVKVHLLEKGHYVTATYGVSDVVPVTVLPGLTIDLKTIFA
jgi:Uma2 family endonuclease